MKYTLDLATQQVIGPFEKDPTDGTTRVSLAEFVDTVKGNYPFSTGIIPTNGSGLISLQRGFGFEQIIYQLKPGIETIRWGAREGTVDKAIYNVALPYRIYIADYKNGSFVGCRHFFSPDPIFHWDQPLYVPNLPNTNCVGYRGTSVGWVCLYLNDNTTAYTFQERIEYFINRMSGVAEPYNDANMSETDGPRFYAARGADKFMTDPKKWQEKTVAEGYEWMLDRDLLKPFLVNMAPELHAEKYVDNGTPYTLNHAANSPYSAYYNDHDYVKPWMKPFTELAPATLMTVVTGVAAPSAKAVVAKKKAETPEELAQLFASIPTPEVKDVNQVKDILNGRRILECANCKKRALKVENVSVKVSRNANSGDLLNIGHLQNWCEACVKTGAIKYDQPSMGGWLYISKHILAYCDSEDQWLPQSETVSCGVCSSNFATANAAKYMIYHATKLEDGSYVFSEHGCVNCVEEPWAVEDTQKLNILCSQMTKNTVHTLMNDPETNGAKFKEITIWTLEEKTFCKCKMFAIEPTNATTINTMGGVLDMCSGCTVIQPGEDPKYVPAFNFGELPTEAII